MTDRGNAFAYSLVLAALVHAAVIGRVRLPRLDSGQQRSKPVMVRVFSIADESTATLAEQTLPTPAPPQLSSDTHRSTKSLALTQPSAVHEQTADNSEEPPAATLEAHTTVARSSADSYHEERLEPSASISDDVARATYEQALAAWLDRVKYYPAAVRRRGLQGAGELRVRIDRNGRVLSLTLSRPLPHRMLGEVARDWVHRADPFPVIPPSIKGENFEFLVPVSFRLR